MQKKKQKQKSIFFSFFPCCPWTEQQKETIIHKNSINPLISMEIYQDSLINPYILSQKNKKTQIFPENRNFFLQKDNFLLICHIITHNIYIPEKKLKKASSSKTVIADITNFKRQNSQEKSEKFNKILSLKSGFSENIFEKIPEIGLLISKKHGSNLKILIIADFLGIEELQLAKLGHEVTLITKKNIDYNWKINNFIPNNLDIIQMDFLKAKIKGNFNLCIIKQNLNENLSLLKTDIFHKIQKSMDFSKKIQLILPKKTDLNEISEILNGLEAEKKIYSVEVFKITINNKAKMFILDLKNNGNSATKDEIDFLFNFLNADSDSEKIHERKIYDFLIKKAGFALIFKKSGEIANKYSIKSTLFQILLDSLRADKILNNDDLFEILNKNNMKGFFRETSIDSDGKEPKFNIFSGSSVKYQEISQFSGSYNDDSIKMSEIIMQKDLTRKKTII